MEAHWHERLKNYLKTDDESLSKGYFVSRWIGDRFTNWLSDNGWTDPFVHEPVAIGQVGLWSPDRQWYVHFDHRSDSYTFLQLIPAQDPDFIGTQDRAAALVEVGAATLSPKEAVERLLPHFMEAADVVSESKAVYSRQIHQFGLWLEAFGRPLGQVSKQDLLSYKDHLLKTGEAGEAVLWIQGKGRDEKDDFVFLTSETRGPLIPFVDSNATICRESNRNGRMGEWANERMGE